MKKYLRFIVAIIALPVFIPVFIFISAFIGIVELLSDHPQWEAYREFHFDYLLSWYKFK